MKSRIGLFLLIFIAIFSVAISIRGYDLEKFEVVTQVIAPNNSEIANSVCEIVLNYNGHRWGQFEYSTFLPDGSLYARGRAGSIRINLSEPQSAFVISITPQGYFVPQIVIETAVSIEPVARSCKSYKADTRR